MEYGTGAIMAVPAHDTRDAEFADAYDLPIVPVIDDDGKLVNSSRFDGLPWREAVAAITAWLSEQGRGKPATNYDLREWSFLRYTDPHDEAAPFDRRVADYWMPIDQYIGGIDHAKGHLLYSRFFVKVLNDLGLLGFREPFQRLFHQGWVKLGGKRMSKSQGG